MFPPSITFNTQPLHKRPQQMAGKQKSLIPTPHAQPHPERSNQTYFAHRAPHAQTPAIQPAAHDKLSRHSGRRIPKVYCHTLASLQRLEHQGRRAHAAAHARRKRLYRCILQVFPRSEPPHAARLAPTPLCRLYVSTALNFPKPLCNSVQ